MNKQYVKEVQKKKKIYLRLMLACFFKRKKQHFYCWKNRATIEQEWISGIIISHSTRCLTCPLLQQKLLFIVTLYHFCSDNVFQVIFCEFSQKFIIPFHFHNFSLILLYPPIDIIKLILHSIRFFYTYSNITFIHFQI